MVLEEQVEAIVSWLDHAATSLNPLHELHYQLDLVTLKAFLDSAASPPPQCLEQHWRRSVWRLPDEPEVVYRLRCLSHHYSVTLLSPCFAVKYGASASVADTVGATLFSPALTTFYPNALYVEQRCRIVGVKVHPLLCDMVQTGWDVQPCPTCAGRCRVAASAQTVPRVPHLPARYGGDVCDGCEGPLPRSPAWCRRIYVVLQRADQSRWAAVVYGDELVRRVQLGRLIDALVYITGVQGQPSLLVLHNFIPSRDINMSICTAGAAAFLTSRTTAASSRSRYAAEPRRETGGCGDEPVSLLWWGRLLAPDIVGQDKCKTLLVLTIVHTLYGALRVCGAAAWKPLHLLLLGPSKSGKSSVLQSVLSLYGPHAECAGRTVVHQRNTTSSGAGVLPEISGEVLLAGTVATAACVVVDDVGSGEASRTLTPLVLHELLDDEVHCGASATAARTAAVGTPPSMAHAVRCGAQAQITAAAQDECTTLQSLVRTFVLIAHLTPPVSLDQSASIGQSVLDASLARPSPTRSDSRESEDVLSCRSLPSSQLAWSPDTRSTSPTLSRGCTEADMCTASGADDEAARLIAEVVLRAPDIATLLSGLPEASLTAYYLPKLYDVHDLLMLVCVGPDDAAALPRPASLRGEAYYQAANMPTAHRVDEPYVGYEVHLSTLRALYVAHVILSSLDTVHRGPPYWNESWASEVWQCYLFHLRSAGEVLQGQRPAVVAQRTLALPLRGKCQLGGSAMGISLRHSKRSRSSRTQRRLHLVEAIREAQPAAGAITDAEVLQLFNEFGGEDVMGASCDVVLGQLQHAGLLLRRLGGWHA